MLNSMVIHNKQIMAGTRKKRAAHIETLAE